ncbi:SIP domain-containing protein [Pedobacter nutrimenti]|jgi:NADPH-dependent ferric siderophore reductase|uniref:Siderophore-interacting protein n=1 Tax=Pedobacter nutrimenti TaxID=1241337 RepID=A0A318UA94_9SPHI|nr:siderophore-interacting protein [Pedobacter nutrimenti]PYF72380.1 siderophore-interacting protein [Pedobacter nutrimenti]
MNSIKKKALAAFEKQFLKFARVLEVRAWDPATFFEIDLHLPDADMKKWKHVQHMKVKVAEYTYRDYTPAMWDQETRTCTLYVNSSHQGPGSKWASALNTGDMIPYLGIGATMHKPVEGKQLLCLGDSSSVGHFLALQQLAEGKTEVYGAVSLLHDAHIEAFKQYFDTKLEPLKEKEWDFSLVSWIDRQPLDDQQIYIAGHIPTGLQLRKHLRGREDFRGGVKVQGFWK